MRSSSATVTPLIGLAGAGVSQILRSLYFTLRQASVKNASFRGASSVDLEPRGPEPRALTPHAAQARELPGITLFPGTTPEAETLLRFPRLGPHFTLQRAGVFGGSQPTCDTWP
jgi:hypothetical protein